MKKAKIIMATALVAAMTAVFVGCGQTKFTKAYTGKFESPVGKKIVRINENLDSLTMDMTFYVGQKAGSSGYSTKYFYDPKGALKFSFADTENVQYSYGVMDYGLYVEKTITSGTTTKSKYTYYDSDLDVIVKESENKSSIKKTENFLFVNDDFYQLDENDKMKPETKKSAGLSLEYKQKVADKAVKYNDKYYVLDTSITSSSGYFLGSPSVSVYNDNLELVAAYLVPTYVDKTNVSSAILPGGNVLVQAFEQVADSDSKYDLEITGEKYLIHTTVLDVKKNSTKEIKVNYVLEGSSWALDGVDGMEFDKLGLNPKLKGIYGVYPIENKRYSDDSNFLEFATLDKGGKLASRLEKSVVGQYSIAALIAENRYVCLDVSGAYYLLDQNGKVIARSDSPLYFKGGVYLNKSNSGLTAYDVNMNIVKSYASDLTPESVYLSGDLSAVKYTDDEIVKVDVFKAGSLMKSHTLGSSGRVSSLGSYGYQIEQNNGADVGYEYYDLNGNVIAKSSETVSLSVSGNIIKKVSSDKTEFILVVNE